MNDFTFFRPSDPLPDSPDRKPTSHPKSEPSAAAKQWTRDNDPADPIFHSALESSCEWAFARQAYDAGAAAKAQESARLAPLCDEHGSGGGARSGCPYCALIEQSRVLSEIDYLCGPPNEMNVSAYDVHCNESLVLDAVRRQIAKAQESAAEIAELKHQHTKTFQDYLEQAAEIERLRLALVTADDVSCLSAQLTLLVNNGYREAVAAARAALADGEKEAECSAAAHAALSKGE